MSFAVLEGGTFYHHETIHGDRLRHRVPRSIYGPDLAAADLTACNALLIADRINPTVLRRQWRVLVDYLASGGTLIVLGENQAHEWAPSVSWQFRPTNFWRWLEQGADPGHRVAQPEHPLFRYVAPRDPVWHYHGLLDVPAGATSLIDIIPEADPERRGGSILYDHPGVGGGRLIVSCLDPMYHHGSFFMPAASRFLAGLLDWLHAEFD